MKYKYLTAVFIAVAVVSQVNAQDLRIIVDRSTGSVELENLGAMGTDLKGYTIGSLGNYLSVDNWTSLTDSGLEGWVEANPSTTYLSELNRNSALTLASGDRVDLGVTYVTGAHQPDLLFEYITTERMVTEGSILYTGPANDLAVYVDPATGDATIANLSPFLDPVSVKGYSILSASSGLVVDTWSSMAGSLGDGWLEANPTGAHLSELNRNGETTFSNSNPVSIGQILTPGSDVRDLVFEYFTSDGETKVGSVEYIPAPGGASCDPNTSGDLDGNGVVEFADFLVLSGNFGNPVASHEEGDIDCNGVVEFADFLVLSGSFGNQVGGVAAVPEPTGFAMWGAFALLALPRLGRRRFCGR